MDRGSPRKGTPEVPSIAGLAALQDLDILLGSIPEEEARRTVCRQGRPQEAARP
jgi:hypothetical protein